MAYTRETVQTIRDRILADIKAEFTDEISGTKQVPVYMKYMVMKVIATAVAFVAHALYGRVEYVSRQLNSTTADEKHLREDGKERGVDYKFATYAKLSIEVKGTGTVTTNDYIVYGDIKFKPDIETVVNGLALIEFTAQSSGTPGNAEIGETMSWEQPVSGIEPTVTVIDRIHTATDNEDIEDYRQRVIEDKRVIPSGGNPEDFRKWALEIPGNVKAWCFPHRLEPGGVSVAITTTSGVPDAQALTNTRNHIMTKMPANIHPDIFEVIPQPTIKIDFTFTHLNPNTPTVQAAIQAELQDFIDQNPVPGITLYMSQLSEVISLAEGEISHTLSLPAADVQMDPDTIPELGVITWPQ